MGNGLFENYGVDIAGLINEHLSPSLLPVILRKWGMPSGGDRPIGELSKPPARAADTVHTARGMISNFDPNEFDSSQLLEAGDRKVFLIAESITPKAEPEGGDTVEIEGGVYRVARVLKREPAGATYVLQVRDM
jgi:hypothetical protein